MSDPRRAARLVKRRAAEGSFRAHVRRVDRTLKDDDLFALIHSTPEELVQRYRAEFDEVRKAAEETVRQIMHGRNTA